jgi:hypothetical protein
VQTEIRKFLTMSVFAGARGLSVFFFMAIKFPWREDL